MSKKKIINQNEDAADFAATALLESPEEEEEESIDLYNTDPDLVDKDIIINVLKAPKILPTRRNSTTRLLEGDRIQGHRYARMVTKHKIPGIQLCYRLTKENLKALEVARMKREGDEPEEWVKEVWAKKSETSTREAMKGRR